jgi:hypothetical protein
VPALRIRSPGLAWGVKPGLPGLATDLPHRRGNPRLAPTCGTRKRHCQQRVAILWCEIRRSLPTDPCRSQSLDALSIPLFRLCLPQARFFLGFPRSLLAAELAQLHRAFVAPRFAAHLRSPFSPCIMKQNERLVEGPKGERSGRCWAGSPVASKTRTAAVG